MTWQFWNEIMLALLKEKCLTILVLLMLVGCKTIPENVSSELLADESQNSVPEVQEDSANHGSADLSVESAQLKEALDRMLVGLNITVSSKKNKYGFDVDDDGTLLVKEGDSLSKIIHSIAGDSQINPDFLQKVFVEANPRAFKRKNPNWLYSGSRLRIPDIDDFRKVIFKQSSVAEKNSVNPDPTLDWIRYPSTAPK